MVRTPKVKEITHINRKIDGKLFTGVYRYRLKEMAHTFAARIRKGIKGKGHLARVIEMKASPKHAVLVDGIREQSVKKP